MVLCNKIITKLPSKQLISYSRHSFLHNEVLFTNISLWLLVAEELWLDRPALLAFDTWLQNQRAVRTSENCQKWGKTRRIFFLLFYRSFLWWDFGIKNFLRDPWFFYQKNKIVWQRPTQFCYLIQPICHQHCGWPNLAKYQAFNNSLEALEMVIFVHCPQPGRLRLIAKLSSASNYIRLIVNQTYCKILCFFPKHTLLCSLRIFFKVDLFIWFFERPVPA